MEISITLKNTFNQSSIFFYKNWCNLHIDQIKERLVKRQLKMLGMVRKKTVSNHLNPNAVTYTTTTSCQKGEKLKGSTHPSKLTGRNKREREISNLLQQTPSPTQLCVSCSSSHHLPGLHQLLPVYLAYQFLPDFPGSV